MNVRRRFAPLVLLIALPGKAGAQTAVPVFDAYPGVPETSTSSAPRDLTVVAGKLFFTADEPSSGREPWVSDGTSLGTEMLADVCPGDCSSNPVFRGSLGALLLFTDESGRLWRSDGTRDGTFALADHAESFAFLAGAAFFPVCDDSSCQLWRTGGTIAGTRVFAPLGAGRSDRDAFQGLAAGRKMFWVRSSPSAATGLWVSDGVTGGVTAALPLPAGARRFTAAGGRLFFLARQDQGEELWTSDGTTAGTGPLSQFAPPAPFEAGLALKAGASGVYFAADDGVHGVEIWKSDGTEAGTVRVTALAPLQPFPPHLDPAQIEEVGSRLAVITFDAVSGYRLFASGGSPASTVSLGTMAVSPFTGLLEAGGRIYFRADDGVHGYELWSTDGRPAGTAMVRDVCPGPCDSQLTRPQALGSGVVFLASDPVHGPQVWTSDGTAAGTRSWTSLPAGSFSPLGFTVAALGSRLYFPAADRGGEELWAAGPGAVSGRLVVDVGVTGNSSRPRELTRVGERLVFTACDGRARELWGSRGAPGTTVSLTRSAAPDGCVADPPENPPAQLTSDGTTAFFWSMSDGTPWLWRTDGTGDPAGTRAVAGFTDSTPGVGMLVHGGVAFFSLFDRSGGALWRSDGTAAGTRPLFALASNLRYDVIHLAWIGESLYIGLPYVQVGVPGGLYRSDGTSPGLISLTTAASFWDPARFTELGGRLFFLSREDGSPVRLWESDGSVAGTHPVSSGDLGNVEEMIEYGGRLYLLTQSALLTSDGTPEGMSVLARFAGDSEDPPSDLVVAAGRLFFAADDGDHGRELWTSDGTAGGTVLVRDLYAGATSSSPSGLAAFAGRLYFAAADGVHGRELWVSDGSAAGTHLAQDVAPGGLSSYPDSLTTVGERLYFTADDGVAGRELWSLPAAGAGCQPAADRLCLGNGRFAVTVAWRDFAGNTGTGQAIPLTADTGGFWFFSPENLELAVKVLDGRALNNAFWVFYGALSNVEYEITVTDTETGLTRRYQNPAGQLASVGDTRGFGPLGAYSASPRPNLATAGAERLAATGSCTPGPQRLCLNGGRFAVEAAWKDFAGNTGTGRALALTGDTGAFWFFGASNLEVFTKVLDGQALNGKFWFFYGALSNVEYTLTVTDMLTGAFRVYHNPAGRLASVADTDAF
jgi:ELWxxDGT repeat protein